MIRRQTSLLLALGAFLCCPAAAHAASPLIGQWPLDSSHEDGAGQVTADVSGNGLDLRVPNGLMHLGTPARFGTGATLGTNLTPLQITSPLLAPTIGSLVMTGFGWRWIFVLLAAIASVILVLMIFHLPEGHQPDHSVSLRMVMHGTR